MIINTINTTMKLFKRQNFLIQLDFFLPLLFLVLKDICGFLYHKFFFLYLSIPSLENVCINSLKFFLNFSNFFLLILIFGFGSLSGFFKSFLDLFS